MLMDPLGSFGNSPGQRLWLCGRWRWNQDSFKQMKSHDYRLYMEQEGKVLFNVMVDAARRWKSYVIFFKPQFLRGMSFEHVHPDTLKGDRKAFHC